MNWLLVAVVYGTAVPTNLVFPTLRECMLAEQRMRAEYVEMYNTAIKRPDITQESKDFLMQQFVKGTCIPTK